MVNENRSLFSLHGMTGFLVATIILVAVVLLLAYEAYLSQVANATNFYSTKDMNSIKMIGSKRADHMIDVK
ncbi:DUF4006 family protein [Sulfurimonas sp. SAG-AH-194-I05]|nr:DUF4006 family protein [Sulfurimonas sp. SAG-AH-194-I05]MDF1874146.1 DUF4006 family protein [Sulfurimonas sp. SAG-AH-194-I05]